MPITLASSIEPAGHQSFYLMEDTYLKGGMRIVPGIADRDAISEINLKLGSLVLTLDTNTIWKVSKYQVPSDEYPNLPLLIEWQRYSGNSVVVSSSPPSGSVPGQFWFDTSTSNLLVYVQDTNGSVWMQI